MRGGGQTLRRRGSIWSVGSEKDDEKRERDEAWMNSETDEKEGREKCTQRESALSGAGSGKD
jgi:hypothetical protein